MYEIYIVLIRILHLSLFVHLTLINKQDMAIHLICVDLVKKIVNIPENYSPQFIFYRKN